MGWERGSAGGPAHRGCARAADLSLPACVQMGRTPTAGIPGELTPSASGKVATTRCVQDGDGVGGMHMRCAAACRSPSRQCPSLLVHAPASLCSASPCVMKERPGAPQRQAKAAQAAPRPRAHLQHAVDLLLALDHELHEVLDVHALVRALLHLQLGLGVLGQQVADVLVVDLQVAGAHKEFLGACTRASGGAVFFWPLFFPDLKKSVG